MACGCASKGSYASCAGFPPFFGVTEGANGELAQWYADRVGAPHTGGEDATHCSPNSLARDVCLCHRMPYFKKTPHDCGTSTKVDITGAGVNKALGLGGAAAGAVSGTAGIITGTTGIAAGLEAGGLAAVGAIAGIAAFGAGLIAIPFAIIAHHSQQEALEEEVLCAMSSGYNNFADQMEQMLKTGQIQDLRIASQLADQVQDQIVTGLQNGLKQCNARCYYTYAIKALTLFCKEQWYPFLIAQYASTKNTTQAISSAISTSGAAKAAGVAAIGFVLKKWLFS